MVILAVFDQKIEKNQEISGFSVLISTCMCCNYIKQVHSGSYFWGLNPIFVEKSEKKFLFFTKNRQNPSFESMGPKKGQNVGNSKIDDLWVLDLYFKFTVFEFVGKKVSFR